MRGASARRARDRAQARSAAGSRPSRANPRRARYRLRGAALARCAPPAGRRVAAGRAAPLDLAADVLHRFGERTSGTTSKLLAGGGEVVNHSSVFAFHGSGPATAPCLRLRTTLMIVTQHAGGEDERADRRDQVVEREVADVVVLVHAPRHPVEADHVLDQERHQEAEEHQVEAQLAQALAQHPPGDLREPVVDRGEDREHRAADQHEVDVGDHEVGFVQLPVDREHGQEHAGDAADQEQRDEADAEQQRRLEFDRAAPQGRDPVEDLHAGRHRDQERAEHHEDEDRLGDRRGEHVVRPRRGSRGTRSPRSRRRSPCSRRSACARTRAGSPRPCPKPGSTMM